MCKRSRFAEQSQTGAVFMASPFPHLLPFVLQARAAILEHTGSTDLLHDGAQFTTALKVFAYIFIDATHGLCRAINLQNYSFAMRLFPGTMSTARSVSSCTAASWLYQHVMGNIHLVPGGVHFHSYGEFLPLYKRAGNECMNFEINVFAYF